MSLRVFGDEVYRNEIRTVLRLICDQEIEGASPSAGFVLFGFFVFVEILEKSLL